MGRPSYFAILLRGGGGAMCTFGGDLARTSALPSESQNASRLQTLLPLVTVVLLGRVGKG